MKVCITNTTGKYNFYTDIEPENLHNFLLNLSVVFKEKKFIIDLSDNSNCDIEVIVYDDYIE